MCLPCWQRFHASLIITRRITRPPLLATLALRLTLPTSLRHLPARCGLALSCRLLALLCLIVSSLPAQALDADRPLRQLHHTAWINKDGAPGEVFTMAQTSDGYLWLGTPTGLFRFDGLRFEPLQSLVTERLASNDIYSLLATPDGGLWIGLAAHGLGFYRDGKLTAYDESRGVPSETVNALARDADGIVWAASNDGLLRFDGKRWALVSELPKGDIQSVFADRAGRVWIAMHDSILFKPRGDAGFQTIGIRIGTVAQFAESPDGSIWIAETSNAVRPVWMPGANPKPPATEIRVGSNGLLFDNDGTLWVTTLGDGLRRSGRPESASIKGRRIERLGKELDQYGQAQGLSGDFTYSIVQDREGDIWIGSSRGLDRFRHSAIVPVPLPSGYHALQMLPDAGDRIWVGSASRRLANVDAQGKLTDSGLAVGLNASFRDASGAYWWSEEPWLLRRKGAQSERIALPADSKDSRLHWIGVDAAQRPWIGLSRTGVYVREQDGWRHIGPAQGLPDEIAQIEYTDAQGRIWLGFSGNVVAMFEGDKARLYTKDDGLSVGDVRVIGGDGDSIWIGGSEGIAISTAAHRFQRLRFQGDRVLRNVAGLVDADDGSLWVAFADGIGRIDARDLHMAEADADHAIPLRLFDHLDGLPGAIQQASIHPAAIRADDGHLWFATLDGLAWVDPQRVMRKTLAPQVQIRTIASGDRSLAANAALDLEANTHEVRIDYNAASLAMPERLRFRYRLQGVDGGWQEAGDRRQAFYTNLDPGRYRFEVSAANADGPWSAPSAIAFTIAPAYYESSWFYALCIAIAASVLWLLYRLRLRQITDRLRLLHQERLIERERIARELHDTLLQSVQGLILRFQGAVLGMQSSDPARAPLLDTLVRANQTLAEGRERVMNLRAGNAEHDLADACAELAQELAQAFSPNKPSAFSLRVEGETRALQAHVYEELLKIGSEALRNAFAHASATSIEVLLSYGASEFALRVQDDGNGIVSEVLRQGRDGHWGLAGMRERAFRLHSRFDLVSAPGLGTSVEVAIPASRAYEGSRPTLFWRLWPKGRSAR